MSQMLPVRLFILTAFTAGMFLPCAATAQDSSGVASPPAEDTSFLSAPPQDLNIAADSMPPPAQARFRRRTDQAPYPRNSAGDTTASVRSNPELTAPLQEWRPETLLLAPGMQQGFWINPSAPVRKEIQPLIKNNDKTWIFFLLFVLFLLSSYVLTAYRKTVAGLFRAFMNARICGQLYRDMGHGLHPGVLLLLVVFFFSFGLYLYLVADYFRLLTALDGVMLYGACVLTVVTAYAAKILLLRWMAFVFPFGKLLRYYGFIIMLYYGMMGLVLLPITVFLSYGLPAVKTYLFPASFFVVLTVFSLRIIRSIMAAADLIRMHQFYFFLYLCTLEISPVLILIRLIHILFIK